MGARVIKANGPFKEGELFNKWIENRMIKKNKNILTVCTGPTGSGKSYQDLRRLELWYNYQFNKEPPIENVCFSVAELMKRLNSKELVKGDILILEEAGANLGSLDFQHRVSKIFTYVLQSFRSLNIGIFFNLPYLSMLNKQARMLIHAQFITSGIDHQTGISKAKAFFLQINQQSGKVYTKYLRVKKNGRYIPVKRMMFSLPSDALRVKYEAKKLKFVSGLTEDFSNELNKIDYEELQKIKKKELTPVQLETFEDMLLGLTCDKAAEKRGKASSVVWRARQLVLKKGYNPEEYKKHRDFNPEILQKLIPPKPST